MRIAKTLILLGTGLLLMGNQSCEKPVVDAPKARKLKKIVDVGLVQSRLIDMPGGSKFDFQYVINQQIYPVLQASEGFAFRYKPPFNESPSQLGSNIKFADMNLATNDVQLLERTFGRTAVPNVIMSDEIACLVNLPQYRLWGTINSFELMNKIGLGLGFTTAGAYTTNGIPGISFGVETYQLDMNMVASNPVSSEVYAAANVTAKQTRTQLEFTLPLSNLMIDPSFYFQTPLARVSYNALENSIKQIQEQLDSKQEWYTRVLYADEQVATILAGSNHNIQKGDVFNIYNEKTFWISENGEIPVPCESKLQSTLDGEPIASIEIFDVSPEAAAGKVVFESGIQIKMGAKVKIRKLVEPVATTSAAASSSSAASSSVKKASLSTNSVRKLNR